MTEEEFLEKVFLYQKEFGDFPVSYFGISGDFADEVAEMIDNAIDKKQPLNKKQIDFIRGDVPKDALL